MTLENITNIDGLFAVINQCRGRVELISQEGDRINLKSRLAQYLALAGMFSDGHIRELELSIEDREDQDRILAFVMSGKTLE
ncbi:MAG: polya polymerase [Stomatobaculum sp.]